MRRRQIDVQVVARDARIGPKAKAYARRKLALLAKVTPAPVLYARVTLGRAADPGVARPVSAKALFDLNGRPVLARVSARRVEEAVDLLEARLSHRLEHLASRRQARHRASATAPRP
jgi:ribosome-associated translation inhibitor RaiA